MEKLKDLLPKHSIANDLFHTVYFVKTLERDTIEKRTSYFVRINTKGMQPFFSARASRQEINVAGEIAKMQWMQIPAYYPNISLDTFTINPGSVQGIVSIALERDEDHNIIRQAEQIFNFPPPKLLLEAFTHFKACCTKSINASMPDLGFGWQPLFTSLLITDNSSLMRFRHYIKNK